MWASPARVDAAKAKRCLSAWGLPEPQEQRVSVLPVGDDCCAAQQGWPSGCNCAKAGAVYGKSRKGSGNTNAVKDNNSVMPHRAGTQSKEVKCKMELGFVFLFLIVKDWFKDSLLWRIKVMDSFAMKLFNYLIIFLQELPLFLSCACVLSTHCLTCNCLWSFSGSICLFLVLSYLSTWRCRCWVWGRIPEVSTLQLGPDHALAVCGSGKNSKVQKSRRVTTRWAGVDDSSVKDRQGENRSKRTAMQTDHEQTVFVGPSALLA